MSADESRSAPDAATTPVGITTLCPQCGASMPAFETRCAGCGHHKAPGTDDEQREQLRRRLQNGIGDAYELTVLLGKGGMGVVFSAREKALDRDVALKVLAFDPIMAPDAFARFEREAKLAARLDHPHIVPIFAVGQGNGIAYYTMRLVRGGSLEELLAREKKLDPPRAVKYLREIAAALDHAHKNQVVHRDIKPANVMLGDDDHVFVADFGIARAVGGSAAALTSTGVVGSPAYMAPEQWQGSGIDGRADQYALGILAYELLTGKRPYRDATMHELLRLHLTEDLPDITQDIPGVSPRARDALRRATAKDPNVRYESASAFVDDLDAALGGAPAIAAPRSATTSGAGALASTTGDRLASAAQLAPTIAGGRLSAPELSATSAAPVHAARASRSKLLPVGAIVVLAAAGGFAYWSSQRAPVAAPVRVSPETVVVNNRTHDTIVVEKASKPETVRVNDTAAAAGASGATASTGALGASGISNALANGAAGATGAAGSVGATGQPPATPAAAVVGYVQFMHPLVPGGTYFLDGAELPQKTPPIYPAPPGVHFITYKGPVATMPPQYRIRVLPGDTARWMFAPAQGFGVRGDSLRARVTENLKRNPAARGDSTDLQRGNGRRGPGGGRGRGGGRRGDTLSVGQN